MEGDLITMFAILAFFFIFLPFLMFSGGQW